MRCAVSGCPVNSLNSLNVHLFEFPKQEDLKELWFQRVNIMKSDAVLGKRKRLFICQRHFNVSEYN